MDSLQRAQISGDGEINSHETFFLTTHDEKDSYGQYNDLSAIGQNLRINNVSKHNSFFILPEFQ